MFVLKRDGKREPVMFDKITSRVKKMCYGLNKIVDPVKVAMRVIEGLYDGVTTSELDNLAAETAATMTTAHPDYAKLAARIAVSNLHKNTKKSFSDTMDDLYHYVNPRTDKKAPLLSDEVYNIIKDNAEKLDSTIIYNRDFNYDYFGFKTLERSYLLKLNGQIAERPQHMLMRVSIGIHKNDIDEAIATYELMSKKYFTHATPTLFNSGTPKPQMSSCFLLQMQDDSIEGIYDTLQQTAKISQSAGGIGLSIHNVRATGSYIRGTNGTSNGIVPMLKVFNDTARYVDQGGGKRINVLPVMQQNYVVDTSKIKIVKLNEPIELNNVMYKSALPKGAIEMGGHTGALGDSLYALVPVLNNELTKFLVVSCYELYRAYIGVSSRFINNIVMGNVERYLSWSPPYLRMSYALNRLEMFVAYRGYCSEEGRYWFNMPERYLAHTAAHNRTLPQGAKLRSITMRSVFPFKGRTVLTIAGKPFRNMSIDSNDEVWCVFAANILRCGKEADFEPLIESGRYSENPMPWDHDTGYIGEDNPFEDELVSEENDDKPNATGKSIGILTYNNFFAAMDGFRFHHEHSPESSNPIHENALAEHIDTYSHEELEGNRDEGTIAKLEIFEDYLNYKF